MHIFFDIQIICLNFFVRSMKTIVPFIIYFLKKIIITFNNLQFCEKKLVDFSFISTKHEPFITINSYIYLSIKHIVYFPHSLHILYQ